MGRLDGKVALISGGARGQGAEEAKLLAREGAKVVLGDVLDDAGKQVEDEIRALGGEATYVHLDVTSENDWVEAVGTAVNRYSKLDILVNNAGISGASASGEQIRERSGVGPGARREWERGVSGHQVCHTRHASVGWWLHH